MSMNKEERTKIIKIIVISLIVIIFFRWILTKFNKPPAQPLPAVVVQKPKKSNITEYITQTGNLVAYNAVDLVARIEGYLEKIEFTDGTFVKKDKELFVIEPKPYMEKWQEALASVAAQKAGYAYAQAEHNRQERMYKENATSLNSVEKWYAQMLEAKAGIDKAVANAAVAEINYSYTHVLSPFDGRIGRHLVDVGNLVGNGVATNLATVEQVDPIYVYLNLNELDILKIRAAAKTKTFSPEQLKKIPVYVAMQNEVGFPHEGQMNFTNTSLNASTGTIEVRAILRNKDYKLIPGLFVQVRIPVSKPKMQLTIPEVALQRDQVGTYVFVVDKNNQVVQKRVQIGSFDQGARAVVSGLNAEDSVIIAGLQNATPGNQVRITQAEDKQP